MEGPARGTPEAAQAALDQQRRVLMIQAQRSRFITTITFFVAGIAAIFSLNLTSSSASFGFGPDGPFILVGGLTIAVILYVGLQRIIPKARPCANCRQPVLIGSTTCPACGATVARSRNQTARDRRTLPPRERQR